MCETGLCVAYVQWVLCVYVKVGFVCDWGVGWGL